MESEGMADEAVLNIVHKKRKNPKKFPFMIKKGNRDLNIRITGTVLQ
jgi:hypothetical protein